MVATTEGERLRWKIDFVFPEYVGAIRKLVTHPRIADLYPEFLFTLHCIMRAGVPLMEAALGKAQAAAGSDPVSATLATYLAKHIPEERGHDEWLLQDMEFLGQDRSAILARPPSPTLASLVGAQYYWILHYHPVALMGFLAPLETHPPTTELIEELIERTGLSPRAFRTLALHAELDPEHGDEINQLLDDLALTAEQSEVLALSAMYTVHMLARATDEAIEQFEQSFV
ncbi:MAG TPA: iron-containing redox enzyme family protein [Actinomycetota bacterium]|nr:iron-containing redox enzyme family protein [Actinomycetota bacterium]